jgi:hypothetical protein
VIESVLLAVLVIQQIYWSWIMTGLVNKLMSRDYQNYVENKKFLNQKPTLQKVSSSDDSAIDPDSERQAQELNSIIGIV